MAYSLGVFFQQHPYQLLHPTPKFRQVVLEAYSCRCAHGGTLGLCEYECAFGFSQEGTSEQANRWDGRWTACELGGFQQFWSVSIAM